MSRKLVGITCDSAPASGRSGPRQTLNRAYALAVAQAGAAPIILPNMADTDSIQAYLDTVNGLLLSGGADIDPARYGQTPHASVTDIEPDRDAVETPLTLAALRRNLPIFAICRGIQMLNVALGGTLYQDLPTDNPSSSISHQQTTIEIPRDRPSHAIQIAPGSRLAAIIGSEEMQTNSMHHQALREVAPGLTITARAPDGVVEAVEHPGYRFVVAVQFHPEETAPNDPASRRLFEAFVAAL